jgi:uncharacterized membrane protein YraQ (UPF0718 family)
VDKFTLSLWVITGTAFIVSIAKDKDKTLMSMGMAKSMMKNMASQIVSILFLIGLMLTFIPPESIKNILSQTSPLLATLASAALGSITLIPAFVAFPLVGSFVDIGMSIVPAVAFLTTLTMVGIATFPLERQEFGTRFALSRNFLSFVFAVVIALVMGVII